MINREKIYLDNMKDLNCLDISYRPKVTETMPEIIEFIQKMLDNGSAYKSGDDVYFDVSKVPDYGILSKQNLEELDAGSRIEVSENKHNPYDFVLWKKTDKGIKWDAPFGIGRPGWHTECVVMINKLLGSCIDIHAGGVDLKFFLKIGLFGMAGITALIMVAPYRLKRILSFLNPWSDPLGSGFQIIQSLYAIGPGGLFGYGFGGSRQKHFYLPEPQTDFIFSIISEEFGFLGVLIVAGLFSFIIFKSIQIALKCNDLFGKYSNDKSEESEKTLLIYYRELNEEGKDKLLTYAEDILCNAKYKKNNKPELLQKNA